MTTETSIRTKATSATKLKTTQLTWPDLAAMEPRLLVLLAEIKSLHRLPSTAPFCANDHWYGYAGLHKRSFKQRLSALVGWHRVSQMVTDSRAESILSSEAAYDLVYQRLYNALPNCRDCGCMGV